MAMTGGGRALLALLAGIAGVVGAFGLGNWQTGRAESKLAAEARWQAAEAAAAVDVRGAAVAAVAERLPQRVRLRGRLLPERSVWLDNRPLEGRAGLLLLTPLVLEDGAADRANVVLVMRGWAPRDAQDRQKLPAVTQPTGIVEVEGMAVSRAPRVYALGEGSETGPLPAIWQNLDLEHYGLVSGLAVAPWVLQQRGGPDDGLVRRWPRPATGVEKHRGYAVQWYSLAGLLVVLTVVLAARTWWPRQT